MTDIIHDIIKQHVITYLQGDVYLRIINHCLSKACYLQDIFVVLTIQRFYDISKSNIPIFSKLEYLNHSI